MSQAFPVLHLPVGLGRRCFSRIWCMVMLWFVCACAGLCATDGKKQSDTDSVVAAPMASSSSSCLECHSDQTLTMRKHKRDVPLFVDQAKLAKSAHSSLECVDC